MNAGVLPIAIGRDITQIAADIPVQPIDAPDEAEGLLRLIDHIDSDEIFLFSTDYPHWQFDDDEALPRKLPAQLVEKILKTNPLSTYPAMTMTSPAVETAT